MLKIKDNISDLEAIRKLEEMGFEANDYGENYSGHYKNINDKYDNIYIEIEGDREIIIDIESTKIIEYEDDEGLNQYAEPIYLKNELDILYDLIQAGLVEKV